MENIGTSDTTKRQRTKVNNGRNHLPAHHEARKESGVMDTKEAKEPQIIAEAGVGKPRKLSCWRSSILNLASLSAEKQPKSKGNKPSAGPTASTYSIDNIIDGSSPKLTTSERESSSLPTSEYAFNNLAAKPSQKSQTAAASIMTKESSSLPSKANTIPTAPQRKFPQVIVFGIFLTIVFNEYAYLIPSFFFMSLERASLWTVNSIDLPRTKASEAYQ